MRNKGFTLIELLTYVAVAGMLLAIVSVFLLESLKLYNRSQAIRETFYNAKNALDTVAVEVRMAKSIYAPATSSSQISLEIAGNPSNGEEASSFTDFFLCQTALCVKREGQSSLAITSGAVEVTSLVVQPVSSGGKLSSVQVDIQLRYKNPQNRPELDFSASMSTVAAIRTP
ncbi:MAG: type II secretion system protein [Candidatus Wildermuthbacteria bacterium]|nr:type II secretion system protein [Candidatus Wildermuthbacteria bacterium]